MSQIPPAPQDEPQWQRDQGQPGQGQSGQGQDEHGQYGQGYPQAPAYQQGAAPAYSPYSQQLGQVEHPRGTLIFVLGLLSILGITILAPFAWVMGRRALREIDVNRPAYSNRGLVMAGYVLGIIGTILLALFAVLFVVGVTLAVVGASNTPT